MAQDENDEIDSADDGSTPATMTGSTSAASLAPPPSLAATPPPIDQGVQNYLQSKLAAAQSQADDNSKLAGLARAGAFLSAGLAGSNQQVNQQPYDELDKEAQAPVQQALQQQKSEVDTLGLKSQMAEAAKTAKSQDPNSAESIATKDLIKRLYPGKFDDQTLAGLSAADLGTSIMKPLELDQKIQERSQEQQNRSKDFNLRAQAQRETASERADAKAEADQSKQLNYVTSQLDSARGDAAVKQAQVDLYSTKKINSLINLYGDPNKMSQAQVRLLASEIGKVATGGVPGQHELEGITPSTLTGRMSEFVTKLTNDPTPANAAAFVKQYQDYSGLIAKDAQATIKGKVDSIVDTHRKQIGDENYSMVKQNYYNRFGLSDSGPESVQHDGAAANLQGSVAAEIQRRKAMRAQSQSVVPNVNLATPPPSPTGTPAYLQANPPQGFAYGGMVGGLPESNFAAGHMNHVPSAPALHLHSPRGYAEGGLVPGHPQFQHNDPRNDVVPANLSKGETVLPLSVMNSKDPAMSAYLFVKQLTKGN